MTELYARKPDLMRLANELREGPAVAIRPRSNLELYRAVMANPMDHLTEDTMTKIHASIMAGNYPETAAQSCGIPQALWTIWQQAGGALMAAVQADPSCMGRITDDEEKLLMLALTVNDAMVQVELEAVGIIKAAGRYDWAAVVWWLSKQHPGRWGRLRETVSSAPASESSQQSGGVLAVEPPQAVDTWLADNQARTLPELPK
jgi:hypothetical protein